MTKTPEIDPLVGAAQEGEEPNPSLDSAASGATGESISASRLALLNKVVACSRADKPYVASNSTETAKLCGMFDGGLLQYRDLDGQRQWFRAGPLRQVVSLVYSTEPDAALGFGTDFVLLECGHITANWGAALCRCDACRLNKAFDTVHLDWEAAA